MIFLYSLAIKSYFLIVRLTSLFNAKAKLFIDGRANFFFKLRSSLSTKDDRIWFHFASLGEFEQGRPVLEAVKRKYKGKEIVVTFFSPSGYEIRKNYPGVKVFYLPMDSKKNAEEFIRIVNPSLAIFTKYEFWHFYFAELKRKKIPLILISSIFRESQPFFKWYGSFHRNMLKCVTRFFVQNAESISLLSSIKIENATLAGDSRFDTVFDNASKAKRLPKLELFLSGSETFIGGSTWPQDEILLECLPDKYPQWKFIIAPHEVDKQHIIKLKALFKLKCLLYSELDENPSSATIANVNVLIIDNIGMLSSLYQYGKMAYIGGGFGVGIHNTLEAAAFGLPIIFGPKYQKFQEAKDLIKIGSAKAISQKSELLDAVEFFKGNEKASAEAKKYVENNKGATAIIMNFINPILEASKI